MIEEMKDIVGYEGEYAITRDGKVWSYKRNKFLKCSDNGKGYYQINLYKNGKGKNYLIHRLVAEAYIPNPEGLPQVNHRDENPQNNCASNLEWCDAKYNANYGTRTERAAKKQSIPVYCEELDKTFNGARQAARELGLDNSSIIKCCKGRCKTTGGYHWKYAETLVEEI